MKKILPLFFLLTSCGLEVPQAIPRLFAPNGVRAENTAMPAVDTESGVAVPANTLRIIWDGSNPEDFFSGYNIYYSSALNGEPLSYNSTKILNINSANTLEATLPVAQFFSASRTFQLDIPNSTPSGTPCFVSGQEYYFYVRAYSQIYNLESPPSLFFKVQYLD